MPLSLPTCAGTPIATNPTTATSQRRSPKTCSRCSTSKTWRTFTFSVMISAARRLWHCLPRIGPRRITCQVRDTFLRIELPRIRRSASPLLASGDAHEHGHHPIACRGREEQYLRHFFRDFAYNPTAVPESEVQQYVMHMRQPGSLRASLNHCGYIPQMAAQTAELTIDTLTVPMLAWGGHASFGDHCFNSAKA